VINEANHVPLSPVSFLTRARRAFPARTAVVEEDGTEVSYAELAADCDALAGALRADGVGPGDRVAVLDLNTRWLLAAHFGVPGAGAALVALNSRLSPADYEQILAHSRARVLLLSPALADRLGVTSAGELPVDRVVMLPSAGNKTRRQLLPGAEAYDEWLARRRLRRGAWLACRWRTGRGS